MLFENLNNDPQGCVGLLYNANKLSDELKFPMSIEARFSISNIRALNGENTKLNGRCQCMHVQ